MSSRSPFVFVVTQVECTHRVFLRRLCGSSTGSLRFAAPPIAPGALCGRLPPCSGTGVPPVSALAGGRGVPPFFGHSSRVYPSTATIQRSAIRDYCVASL